MATGEQPPGRSAWIAGRRGTCIAFAWGFAEGTFFFLIPDVWITLVALFSFKRSLLALAATVAGSLCAGLVMYRWAQAEPLAARQAVERVPFVRAAMFETTERDFETLGVWALCKGPASGIPYKVYAVQVPAHAALPVFLLVSIPARLERLLITWVLFALVGIWWRKRAPGKGAWAAAGHGLYWCSIYAYYWTAI